MTPPTAMATTPADASRWIFRANASWEVVPYDRLRPNDQASLAAFARDPEFFGVLRPRQVADGTIKAISRSVALLIYALETPGIIPRVAVASGDASILDAAWRLTLDGVLEVARGDEFVSGAHALTTSSTRIPDGVIARLSMDALQFVARIGQADAATMSERLYHYNRRPFTPRWGARIRSASDVLAFAGAGPGTPASAALEQHWRHKTMERRDPWLSWWPRTAARRTRRAGHADVTYKLYVNPQTEALPTAFPAFVDVLREAGAPPFKIGASAGKPEVKAGRGHGLSAGIGSRVSRIRPSPSPQTP